MKHTRLADVQAARQGALDDPELIWVDAIYRERPEDRGVNNPLIRALPPIVNEDDVLAEFRNAPYFAESERALPKNTRVHLVGALNLYLETLPCHVSLIESIFRVVTQGYEWRNPNECIQAHVRRHYALSMTGDRIVPIVPIRPSHAAGLALFGVSGVGKSTSLVRTLSFFPQVIRHQKLSESNLQVVWLKVDCPPDGSINQLFHWILAGYDRLLKTTYAKDVGVNARQDALINKVAAVAKHHHTGIIVIDEVQFAVTGAAKRGDTLMDFFVTFTNVVGVPLFIAGTPKALSLFEKSFRLARRTGDHGAIIYTNLPLGDDWDYFLSGLFEYQWTASPVAFDGQLSRTMHDLTQGIHSLVIRLFQLAQIHAIRDGSEQISSALLRQLAKDRFGPVQPMLGALRSKKRKNIELYDDLLVDTLSGLTEEIEKHSQAAKIRAAADRRNSDSTQLSAISHLVAMGIPQTLARKTVLDVLGQCPGLSGAELLRAALLRTDEAHQDFSSASTKEEVSLSDIVNGANDAEKALDALRRSGLVA